MGLRERRKHSQILRFASVIYDLMVLFLFNTPFHANSGSYVAFKTEFVRNIPFRMNDHRYLPLIAIRRGARNLSEVIVRHHARTYGRSKYRSLKKLLLGIPEVLGFMFRLKSGVYDAEKKQSAAGD
jgi:dolichol-phosphate mannosyltransferase